jgi:hypothetical protein
VQAAIGPLDRLFEASRKEMSDREGGTAEKAERIERAQAQRPSKALIDASGWLRNAWIIALATQVLAAFGLSINARSTTASAQRASPEKMNSGKAARRSVSRSSCAAPRRGRRLILRGCEGIAGGLK